jgi:hypothetical protein
MIDPVASRRLICVRPSGESLILTMTVGKPHSHSGDARCPVSLDPLYSQLGDIVGADSWQALQLAIRLVEQLLKAEVEKGSRLYWPKDGTDESDSEYEFGS